MTPASLPARGRPRSEATSQAVLAAAFALLRERGYAHLAFEAVAARAGVAKTSIYRRWPNRAALAVDAFFHATEADLAFPDTGLAREDFARQITGLAELLRGPTGAAMVAMVAGARSDPVLAQALGERWLKPRQRWGVERMQRAMAAGECRAGIDVAAALNLLYSPLYAPLLFGRGVPGPAEVAAVLAISLPAIFVG